MSSTRPTIVIYPGAYHYTKHYSTLINLLRDRGYEVVAVEHKSIFNNSQRDTPHAQSHHDDAAQLRSAVTQLIEQGRDVLVWCHSYGGIPTTEALAGLGKPKVAEASKVGGVTHIIYCCAFVVQSGQSLADVATRFPEGVPSHWAETVNYNGLTQKVADEQTVTDAIYHDVDPAVARSAYGTLGYMPLGVFISPQVNVAHQEIPCTYILCEADRVVKVEVQEAMTKEAGITDVVRFPGSHSPFLTRPGEVADVVERIMKERARTEGTSERA